MLLVLINIVTHSRNKITSDSSFTQ